MIQPNFKWWMGVVEDRADPERLGRYRVRILGYHTANKVELPTHDLPWASSVMPVTSASVSGVADTPNLVEGSTVVGFFGDGDDEQLPVIMGSLLGIPLESIQDENVGFSDPFNNFPRQGNDEGYNDLKEPDISRLARGINAETHASLLAKRESVIPPVPTAKAPNADSVTENIPGADYDGATWNEPHPRFGSTATGTYTPPGQVPTFEDGTTSVYPYNSVRETESGHVFEVDDTPGNGRIHEYHNAGTFYEIQADGTKITKVVGDDYEISIKDKNVFIQGACNVTIGGNSKLRVEGDMYQEITGNLFTTVGKNRVTKIVGNDTTEILSGFNLNIGKEMATRVASNHSFESVGDSTNTIGGSEITTTGADYSVSSSLGRMDFISGLGVSTSTVAGNIISSAPLGTFRANGLGMELVAQTTQTVVAGAAQLIEAGGAQTLSVGGIQTTTAATRLITSGVTTHAGVYNIAGAANVTGTFTAGNIWSPGRVMSKTVVLGLHTHSGGGSGPPNP
jgi:hypothetical protein